MAVLKSATVQEGLWAPLLPAGFEPPRIEVRMLGYLLCCGFVPGPSLQREGHRHLFASQWGILVAGALGELEQEAERSPPVLQSRKQGELT